MNRPIRSRLRYAWLILAALPSLGFTDCSEFHEVTVPRTDTDPPAIATKIIVDGGEPRLMLPGSNESRTEFRSVILAPAALDFGGVRRISYQPHALITCRNLKDMIGQQVSIEYFRQTDSQEGQIGSRVSNGEYLLSGISRDDFAGYCAHDFQLASIDYTWTWEAEDFHGNRHSGDGSFTYEAPGLAR
jgi:hypothetical protein